MCLVISDNILTARGKENKVEREEGGREVESKMNGTSSKQQPSRALPLPPRSLPPKPLQKPTALAVESTSTSTNKREEEEGRREGGGKVESKNTIGTRSLLSHPTLPPPLPKTNISIYKNNDNDNNNRSQRIDTHNKN